MLRRRHEHKAHNHKDHSQEGFISSDNRKSMNKNEKVIMGILVAGIIVFLILSIIVLFGKGKNNTTTSVNNIPTVPTNMTTHTPYPTIPPIVNTTIMVNSRRFNPSVATIPKEGFIEFLNIDADAITIEANDENSKILNIGTLEPSDMKEVRFNAPGTYTYRNKEKPQMTGIIIIK
jgi:plastocyanin